MVYGLIVGVDVEQHLGTSTLPCGSPFFCRCHRIFSPFRTTKKRRLSSMVRISSVMCRSPVISNTSQRSRRRWLTVSCAADKSTKTAPMIWRFSYPSSVCSVRLSSWLVHNLPGRNHNCLRLGRVLPWFHWFCVLTSFYYNALLHEWNT